jgi:hypothetical protein
VPDVLNTKWARAGRAQVEAAAVEWNAVHPRSKPIKVVWGHSNAAQAQELQEPGSLEYQAGLLSFQDVDVDIAISSDDGGTLHSRCYTGDGFVLPLGDPRELFNVLECCYVGVSLMLVPTDEEYSITVLGVESAVLCKGLTGVQLGATMNALLECGSRVVHRLADGFGDDLWDEAGGIEGPAE